MKTLIRWLKLLLGYPMPPRPEQIGERLVTMREERDCLVAAIATLLEVSYEVAHRLVWHFNLPGFLESPLLSNPLNAERALKKANANPRQIGLTNLLNGTARPGKVLVLVHDPENPLFAQHWVVWFGTTPNATCDEILHMLHWGQNQDFVYKTQQEMIDLVTAGWPNCIIEVG
jgi:hypothetical protein